MLYYKRQWYNAVSYTHLDVYKRQVSVTVDAISDKEFTGKVTSISGATGSKYSLVPTDNSAGNFVKIQPVSYTHLGNVLVRGMTA